MLFNGINIAAFHLVQGIASPALNFIMSYWAESYYLVLPLIAIYLYYRRDRNVYSFVFATVFLFIIANVLKDIFMEPRPCSLPDLSWINHVACESGYSFPSDHAVTLTGLAFFAKGYKYLRIAYIVWLLAILFGRVYLGQHYLTDVVAGAIISIIVAYVIYKYRDRVNSFLNKALQALRLGIFTSRFN